MLPASTTASGQCMTPGPTDVCKTPSPGGPVPMPYPNIAMCMQASPGTCSSKTTFLNMKVIRKDTEIPMSNGDNAGVAGGVVSNTFMQTVKFQMVSSKVKVEGKGVAHVTSMTAHNGNNANMPSGSQVAPSQAKVLVAQ